MRDVILDGFLHSQFKEGMKLAGGSNIVDILPVEGSPPFRYVVRFKCNSIVQSNGKIETSHGFYVAGITFHREYLRFVGNPYQIVTWLAPGNIFHPNILPPASLICLGKINPGTGLIDIIFRIYNVIRFANVTPVEGDALNKFACKWYRENCNKNGRFPVDNRPLRAMGIRKT